MSDKASEIPECHEARVLLMLNWRRRAIRASNGHYRASNSCRQWSNFMTCFNIISAIAVLFFSNNRFFGNGGQADETIGLLGNSDLYTAIAGLLVVLTTALQYVLKLETKTKDAKSAGNDFTNIKREIELLLSESSISLEKARSIQISHTHASRNHELVPRRIWQAASEQTATAFLEDAAFEQSVLRKFGLSESTNIEN
ncbi:hypothetical protein [uncultured Roseobacter sp.]|uniref:hypothetical protein n=1 Tax=uncultured Roseobacter sp. TaxID=114847 RepID=UPI0026386893|nr:hypothetical protein [uncultured Roseobacter sp.]